MSDIIRLEDQFYILATSPFADDRTWTLKDGDTFAVFDRYGDIHPLGLGEQGLYHEGTRFLSKLEFRLGKNRPLILSSALTADNILVTVDMTNPDFYLSNQVMIPRGTLHIFRSTFLWKGTCYQKIKIWNLGLSQVDTIISLFMDADFADIFEVRGTKRKQRGKRLEDKLTESSILLDYEGLDNLTRRTRIDCSPKPRETTRSEVFFDVSLPSKGQATYFLTISLHSFPSQGNGQESRPPLLYDHAFAETEQVRAMTREQYCEIDSSNQQFNDWVNRSLADVQMMVTQTSTGSYPYAGVPWFSAPFGRDGIINAFQTLWMNPEISKGVLSFLAAHQAKEINIEQEAEPGRILHETRTGEMSNLQEIPFSRYYGSVDSTPLFILLAGAYFERTGDLSFIESLWPNLEFALQWMDNYGDMDGDGFIEYQRHSARGLLQQGWKDSDDSVFHADGSLAEGPIALCEVQGYAYAARKAAAELARVLGKTVLSQKLLKQASALQEQFEEKFWSDELSTYVLALDGKKSPCRVRTSNAGHALFSGIASKERARKVADGLVGPELFSGWGIRTVGSSEILYNPMSYHNGSVWPHDNSLIGYGMGLYGLTDSLLKILNGLFEASMYVKIARLPELICGFARRANEGPTLYPVACSPQAWASGSVFLLLQACLGLKIKGSEGKIYFTRPFLPAYIHELRIKNLKIGKDSIDLFFQRHLQDVNVNVSKREGDIEIIMTK